MDVGYDKKYSWQGRIVFVSNMNYHWRAQDIMIIMRQFGRVYRVDLGRNKLGRSTGYAFIEFADQEHAKTAVKYMDQAEYQGRFIRCELAKFPPQELIEIYRKTAKQMAQIDSGEIPNPADRFKNRDTDSHRISHEQRRNEPISEPKEVPKEKKHSKEKKEKKEYSDSYYYSDYYSDYSSYGYYSDYSSYSSDYDDEKNEAKRK